MKYIDSCKIVKFKFDASLLNSKEEKEFQCRIKNFYLVPKNTSKGLSPLLRIKIKLYDSDDNTLLKCTVMTKLKFDTKESPDIEFVKQNVYKKLMRLVSDKIKNIINELGFGEMDLQDFIFDEEQV